MATDLYIERAGSGPLILLAHGFAGSARNFRPQQRALRDRHRVIAYDARGHARSPAPRDLEACRLECLAADLGAVLAGEADEAPAIVGGLSLGAATALRFALDQPQRVRGLLLASPPAGGGRVGGADALAFAESIERDGLEAAGERFVWGQESGLDASAAALVRQGFLEHEPDALAMLLRGALAGMPTARELAPELAKLRIPTLAIAGAEDPASLAAARELTAYLPDARLLVIEAAGHVVNLSKPDAFNAALRAFASEL